MLSIILNILKIIGIILLCLIGLILLILLLVLLVPVRYSLEGGKPEEPDYYVDAVLSWLLRLLRVDIHWSREGLVYSVHILKYRLAGTPPEEESKDKAEPAAEEPSPQEAAEQEEGKARPEETEAEPAAEEPSPQEAAEQEEGKEACPEDKESSETAYPEDKEPKATAYPEDKEPKESGYSEYEKPQVTVETEETDLLDKIDQIIHRIHDALDSLREKAEKAQELKEKAESLPIDVYISFGLDLIKRILLHIRPRKVEGSVDYGMNDAYTTGKITGYVAMAYPMIGPNVTITPHFDQKILKGHLKCRGRLFIGFLVWQIIRILMNKDIRNLILMIIRNKKKHSKKIKEKSE